MTEEKTSPEVEQQISQTLDLAKKVLGSDILGFYNYGSSVHSACRQIAILI